jgi:hypothetical protein
MCNMPPRNPALFIAPGNNFHRLEYVLMDKVGTVYDFQQENLFNDSGLGIHELDSASRI